MRKLKKSDFFLIGLVIAILVGGPFLLGLLPYEANGTQKPNSQIRRIPLGEEIHSDYSQAHIYYYHGSQRNDGDQWAFIGHLATNGVRAGMTNMITKVGVNYILDIGTKQYRVAAYDYTWIELEEVG